VIYPDPSQDRWRHAQSGPSTGILDGHLDLPASATPAQARQAAETLLAELSRTHYHQDLTIDWHPPDAKGWITGEINQAPRPTRNA
jgi:hypothetical protein